MKFGGIGIPELLIILAVALLIFGPKNLPKLGSALGKTVKNLRDGMGSKKELKGEPDEEEETEEISEEKPAEKKAPKEASSTARKKAAAPQEDDGKE